MKPPLEYRPDGRQKVTTPNQPKPLSPAESELARIKHLNRDRQARHRAKQKK